MSKINRIIIFFWGLCTLIFLFQPVSVLAEDKKWFIGAGVGGTEIESDVVLWTILNPNDLDLSERDLGFKVHGGYKINDFLSIELAYVNFGELEITGGSGATFYSDGIAWQFNQDGASVEVDYYTVSLSGTVSFPLNKVTKKSFLNRITPYAKLGAHYWNVNKKITVPGSVDFYSWHDPKTPIGPQVDYSPEDKDGLGWFYGAGFDFSIYDDFSIVLGWEWYKVEDDMVTDSDILCGSAIFRF